MKGFWRCRHISFVAPLLVTFVLLYLLIEIPKEEKTVHINHKRDLKVARGSKGISTEISHENITIIQTEGASNTSRQSTTSKQESSSKKSLQSLRPSTSSLKWSKKRLRVKSNMRAAAADKNSPEFKSVMEYTKNFQPHLTRELFKDTYTDSHPELCSADDDVILSIMVISSPGHFKQREAIRKTWGRQGEKGKGLVVGFMVGEDLDKDTSEKVLKESEEYKDVIINTMTDKYEHLSLKTLSAFNWILKYCPQAKYMLKVDDDMFVQIDRLFQFVKELLKNSPGKRLIIGNISRGWKPVRNPESKYYISTDQYDGGDYPAFATGPSYLLSIEALEPIFQAAMDHKYIHLEDVFLTGVVAEEVGALREDQNMFKNNANRVPPRFMGCTINHTITIHKVIPEEQEDLYNLAKDGAKCGPRGGDPGRRKKMDKDMKKSLEQWWKQRKKSMQQIP